jgi:glycopeptide antibiotics resistance protein
MKQKRLSNDVIIPALFALYIYVLFKIILFKFGSIDMGFLWQQLQRGLGDPDYIIGRLKAGNLIPLKEISKNIQKLSSHDLINLVGNIGVFMPYGTFLGLMSTNKKMSFIGVFTRSLGLSLCLECAQVVFSIGSFDVDDLILNSCGGLIGYIAFKLCAKFMVTSTSVIQERDRNKLSV